MQLIPRYLVNNRTTLVLNDIEFVTEYRPVYSRQLQVYRGIDNNVEFRFLNADQKPVALGTKVAKFVAFDESNNLILEKTATAGTATGVAIVNISENDLLNLKDQFLKYNVYLEETDGQKTLSYSQPHFENNGTIHISSVAFPGAQASKSVTQFTETQPNASVWVSEQVDAQPGINGNEAVHTVAIYSDSFIGDVEVQATLDNQPDNDTAWTTVATATLNNETAPVPVNFVGVHSYIRFRTTADPASKISKILVRN